MTELPKRARNLLGVKVGKLKVISYAGAGASGRSLWLCECDCGRTVIRKNSVIHMAIRRNQPSHCGCSNPAKTHGMTKSHKNLYWVWAAMIQRCENPLQADYKNYGARGISVCLAWRNDFSEFARWAESAGYRRGLTIERSDNNGNYCPENCIFTTIRKNTWNQRKTVFIEWKGESRPLQEWAEIIGVSDKTLRSRIFDYGWSVERAMTELPEIGKNQFYGASID